MYDYITLILQILLLLEGFFYIVRALVFAALETARDRCYLKAVELESEVSDKLANGSISELIAKIHAADILKFRNNILDNNVDDIRSYEMPLS
ncbi:hypothetical protein FACS189443_5730 [Planctomycetales bacterium]|nr:hypothetical protein FACS189443_5730 [Planctomycetales bacterium]